MATKIDATHVVSTAIIAALVVVVMAKTGVLQKL